MSRRMMDSSMLGNRKFGLLPARGQVLQMAMIMIADDQGRLDAHPLYLSKEIFRYAHVEPTDISKWLEQLHENGTIILYVIEANPYAQFVNWWEYQSLQFAKPSKYPRPDGWQDHLRFNSKGNQMLVCNWTTPKGEPMVDTCDQDGKPIPFVMELPAKQKLAQAAPKAPTLVPTIAPTLVPTIAPTEVATDVPAIVPTQVNHDYDHDYDHEEEERGESGYAAPPPAPDEPLPDESTLKPGQHLYRAVCEILGWDTKTLSSKSQVQVAEAVRKLMAADYTCEELERFMGEVWAFDLRWTKKKQRPTLEEFQAEVGKLHAGAAQTKRSYSGSYERAKAEDATRRKQYSQYNDLLPKLPKGKPS